MSQEEEEQQIKIINTARCPSSLLRTLIVCQPLPGWSGGICHYSVQAVLARNTLTGELFGGPVRGEEEINAWVMLGQFFSVAFIWIINIKGL